MIYSEWFSREWWWGWWRVETACKGNQGEDPVVVFPPLPLMFWFWFYLCVSVLTSHFVGAFASIFPRTPIYLHPTSKYQCLMGSNQHLTPLMIANIILVSLITMFLNFVISVLAWMALFVDSLPTMAKSTFDAVNTYLTTICICCAKRIFSPISKFKLLCSSLKKRISLLWSA